MTPIATKNGAIIVKDGSVAESCNCCGGWYCYCPVPNALRITINGYFSDYYLFSTTQVDGQYKLQANNCLGGWLFTSTKGSCDANSGAINGIAISVSEHRQNGLWVKAGDSAAGGWCVGWQTDTFSNAITTSSGDSAYLSACRGDFPISGSAIGQSNGVIYFSFSWSIDQG